MPDTTYHEALRPQFHFTARAGWLNDPNGLVYYDGEYHLFFQHNPHGTEWGSMTWGHAVSEDLVHWQQLANALEPDAMGTMFSGSAVIDSRNTAGFGDEAMIAFYTAAGEHAEPTQPFTQCLAYSTDRGRTFTKYAGNPIVPAIAEGTRDPKVFRHASPAGEVMGDPKVLRHGSTGQWVMVLYVDGGERSFRVFVSEDLKSWEPTSEIEGLFECPEMLNFGDDWYLFDAPGLYYRGGFDGQTFTPRSGQRLLDYGPNFYAAQAYNDIPASDGRRILIGWMRGGSYPAMPFNQQMTFPRQVTARAGVLHQQPVREIESLYRDTHDRLDTEAELLDVDMRIEVGEASTWRLTGRGLDLRYLAEPQQMRIGRDGTIPVPTVDGCVQLRLLIDRMSVELFANGGAVTYSACQRCKPGPLRFESHGGTARITDLAVRELASAWA